MSRRCFNCQRDVEEIRIKLLNSSMCSTCASKVYASFEDEISLKGSRRKKKPHTSQTEFQWLPQTRAVSTATNVVSYAHHQQLQSRPEVSSIED